MTKYILKQKAIVIEAIQWKGDNLEELVKFYPHISKYCHRDDCEQIIIRDIRDLEGKPLYSIGIGDFIVKNDLRFGEGAYGAKETEFLEEFEEAIFDKPLFEVDTDGSINPNCRMEHLISSKVQECEERCIFLSRNAVRPFLKQSEKKTETDKVFYAVQPRKEGGYWIRKIKIKFVNNKKGYYVPFDNSKEYGFSKIRFCNLDSGRSGVFSTLEKAMQYLQSIIHKRI